MSEPELLVNRQMLVYRPVLNVWRRATVLAYIKDSNKKSEEPLHISSEVRKFLDQVKPVKDVRDYRI